ncbi:MAG: hypothetical protein ABIA02_03790 [Candidatus Falkowbacteria bacterium]
MLENLFGSKARVKLLKLFLLNPEEKFFVRQLSRDLKLQLNSVSRELENLEKIEIIISKSGKGKQEKKYYQANTDFVLFEEIKALIVKAQILYKNDFVEKIKKIGNIKLLILTGIFTNNPDAPIDMLIVGRVNKTKFLGIIKELELELGKEINFTLMGGSEFKYRRDVTDMFLYEIFEGKKIVVIDEIEAVMV